MRKTALDTVYELAKRNERVVFIGSDLGHGTLDNMKKELPKQFFMEGISEQHIIGFACGLAKEGYIPFLNTIANFFTRRALEQIILDVALHGLPVKILASGGGMVYAPLGPTHTAVDDLAHMLSIPKLNVYAPSDALEMKSIIELESNINAPAYIRFGKGGEEFIFDALSESENREFKFIGDLKSEIAILTTGVTTQICINAANMINSIQKPVVIHFPKLNLANFIDLYLSLKNKKKIIIVEEHQEYGGLLTQILHFSLIHKLPIDNITPVNLGFDFIRKYGSQQDHFYHSNIIETEIIKAALGE